MSGLTPPQEFMRPEEMWERMEAAGLASNLCDWHRMWEPLGKPKCGSQATHNLDGYGGSRHVRFCCEHYSQLRQRSDTPGERR